MHICDDVKVAKRECRKDTFTLSAGGKLTGKMDSRTNQGRDLLIGQKRAGSRLKSKVSFRGRCEPTTACILQSISLTNRRRKAMAILTNYTPIIALKPQNLSYSPMNGNYATGV